MVCRQRCSKHTRKHEAVPLPLGDYATCSPSMTVDNSQVSFCSRAFDGRVAVYEAIELGDDELMRSSSIPTRQ